MGLVANVIEAAGISTACLSMIPPLTRNTGAPRVIGVGYPMGLPLGLPGHADDQRAVLRAALEAAAEMDEPRLYVELPFEWPERRAVAMREPATPPPIVQLLNSKPWLLAKLVSGHVPDPAAGRDEPSTAGRRVGDIG